MIAIAMLLFSTSSFSQALVPANLGILTSFEAFTGAGAVSNAGGEIVGDVGTNFGLLNGLDTTNFSFNKYAEDEVTDVARKDLLRLYIHLNDLFVDYYGHSAAFGAGETITPGVYALGSAGSIGANLTLDGGGDPDAFFIIKFNGALTVGAAAAVHLTGGAQSCNVFWIANGAISVAAGADVKGTLYSKTGAIDLGANTVLEGRMFSMAGAISTAIGVVASLPPGTITIPIFCESECNAAPEVDVLGVLSDYALFANSGIVGNTSISGIIGEIGTNAGAITGYSLGIQIGEEHAIDGQTVQGQIDLNAAYDALMALPATGSHIATFFNETLAPGVYDIGTAGAVGGAIILDGAGNPDAIFVVRVAGALNIAAATRMILTNGAKRCNIFWIGGAGIPTGAVNIGASCVLKGNFISHGGACNSGAGCFIAGRQLSTLGAVNTNTSVLYTNPECITSKALGIDAVVDITEAVDGTLGGTTTSLTENDVLLGDPVIIGTDPGNIILTGVTVPPGFTLNPDGTVTIPPNTPAGDYTLTYQICEVGNPTNCDSVTSTIVVSAPSIDAVEDTTDPVNGTTGGTTASLTENDVLLGNPVVIGTDPGNVILAGVAVPPGFTLNPDGTVTIPPNTPAGEYSLTYQICEVSNPTNCDSVTSTIVVSTPAIALVKTAIVSGAGMLGDVITYVLTIENTGSATLSNVVVTDPMIINPIIESPIASLVPGATSIAIATYTITQSDIDAGSVTNSATATAQDPNGIDVNDISGTANDNDTPTVTLTAPPVVELPDFTPTIDIDGLSFVAAGSARDFVVNVSEVEGAPSDGQVVLKIVKGSAFLISYGAAASTSNVGGGVSVNNNDWDITENPLFITMTLKAGVVIGANAFSAIGFTIERNVDVPSQTSQPITATIVDGSGSDSQNYGNTYNTVVIAQ
jgi:hypothetical protein